MTAKDEARRQAQTFAAVALVTILTLAGFACSRPALTPIPVPVLPAAPLSEPPSAIRLDRMPVAPEKLITLTGDWDVRLALTEIAKTAGYSLVLSPKIASKKVRLGLVNVPTSEALRAVLDAGGLSLESSNGIGVPSDPSVVFYQLPVNVDSMSVTGIMKRFGVSRELAEMIVQARLHP